MTTKISVLTSVYNGSKYIKESINSILSQTLQDFEYIIINDASTDNTKNILKSFKDHRLKIITNKRNLGLTKSLNIGLKEAKGEYIARMDSDDISLPNRLKTQLDFMESNPNIVLLGTAIEVINELGERIDFKKKPSSNLIIKFKSILTNPFFHPTLFFRKNIILKEEGYNENFLYTQDYELTSRLINKYQLANISKPLLRYRTLNQSITNTPTKRQEQLNCALKISHTNTSKYINIDINQTSNIIKLLNNKKISFITYLHSINNYRNITKQFIANEKLNSAQKKEILLIYKSDCIKMTKNYIKNIFKNG